MVSLACATKIETEMERSKTHILHHYFILLVLVKNSFDPFSLTLNSVEADLADVDVSWPHCNGMTSVAALPVGNKSSIHFPYARCQDLHFPPVFIYFFKISYSAKS